MPDRVDRIDGIRVTSLADTVAGLAVADRLETAVVAGDAALAGIPLGAAVVRLSPAELQSAIPSRGRGCAIARFVAGFVDGRSASPGESLSRLAMHRAGVPEPVLQLPVRDRRGVMFVDFAWPALGVVGEFDGVAEYVRDEFTRGRSAADVVIQEKIREDRLRALGWRVVRWGWNVARSVPAMRRTLREAGVR